MTMTVSLKAQTVTEFTTADELSQPGDYCYKSIAVAEKNGTKFVKGLVINCPFCGRMQLLRNYRIRYKARWRRAVNEFCQRYFNWQPFKTLNSIISIATEITCVFNPLHKYWISDNNIKVS